MGPSVLAGEGRGGYPEGMKTLISTAALLLSASVSFAQVRVTTEISVPVTPAGAAINSASVSAMPTATLMPALPAASITPAAAAPVPAATPAPITARAALVNTGASLAAASKGEGNPAEISRRAFDAASKYATEPYGEEVSLPHAVGEGRHNAGLEGPDFARRFNSATKEPSSPLKTAAWETVEVGATSIPFLIAAAVAKLNLAHSAWLIPAMLAVWGVGFWAMRSHLSTLRRKVVGGWQASHDQKYRVDPSNGRMKDIRGHKYGEDRYEEYENGPVGRTASLAIGAAAVLGAAAFLLL